MKLTLVMVYFDEIFEIKFKFFKLPFSENCPNIKCDNQGFIDRNCKCKCPGIPY